MRLSLTKFVAIVILKVLQLWENTPECELTTPVV